MKLKNSLKKLSLVKQTVAHLSEEQMKNANGGEVSIPTVRSFFNCDPQTLPVMADLSDFC
jgi:hypothetical protein